MKKEIKQLLELEVKNKNSSFGLQTAADPLRVAKPYNNEYIALICALFAYGNAKLIEKFLLTLDFDILDDEKNIREKLAGKYYRFQTNEDVIQLFKTLNIVKKETNLEDIFLQGYNKEQMIMDGIHALLSKLYQVNSYTSSGYRFLLGKIPEGNISSPYKRWNMFLRWMVRDDNLDMGLWKRVDKSKLLIPLDVHTFNVAKKLGLLKRKSYDFKAVLELTQSLSKLDKFDPIKYDFALYRLGQSGVI